MDSISELERRLESSGYEIGLKILELISYRNREVGSTFYDNGFYFKLLLRGNLINKCILNINVRDGLVVLYIIIIIG